MAKRHLGPELPSPFSVLSENFLKDQMNLPSDTKKPNDSFGEDYEVKICKRIQHHAGLHVDDKVCYVGAIEGGFTANFM